MYKKRGPEASTLQFLTFEIPQAVLGLNQICAWLHSVFIYLLQSSNFFKDRVAFYPHSKYQNPNTELLQWGRQLDWNYAVG